jgi:hypothetical protein
MPNVQQQVVDAIVQWAVQLERPLGRNRVNRKLLFGDAAISSAVGAALHALSDDRRAFIVRSSTDSDAVRLRNERPAGISGNAAIMYLVFWLPGHPGHERNFESLRDFPAVTLEDLLARTDSFMLGEETVIATQCREAAQAWPEKDRLRAEEHLAAAWVALRSCLRELRGGRDRSIPFIERLSDYIEYLNDAFVPENIWEKTPLPQRAAVALERWGRALPRLSMFALPALASIIGVQVDPLQPMPSAKKSGESKWVNSLEEILAENKDTATDFAGLGENIAGKQTLRERLDDLSAKIRLCQSEQDRGTARIALEQFCQSGDDLALRRVEWLFRQNPTDRRSASQGLKGLLIARKLRQPRENPLDKAARETMALIERLAGEDVRESGLVRQYIEERKTRTVQSRREAAVMADILHTIASGAAPSALVPTPLGPVFERVLASPDKNAQDFERLARSWDKFGRTDGDAPVVADSVLLGLLQLSYARLREQEPVGDRYQLTHDGDSSGELVLTAAVEGDRVSLSVKGDDWGEQARTEIHRWLLDKVRPLYFEEKEPDSEDQVGAITLDVEWAHGRTSTPFGVIEIPMPQRRSELVTGSRRQALVSIRRECRSDIGRLLGELFEGNDSEECAEDPRDDKLRSAWTAYVRALGEHSGWGTIACVAPLPSAAEGWVNAWESALSGVSEQAQIREELRSIEDQLEGEGVDVKTLMQRRKELIKLQQAGPPVDMHTVRSLLRLCTGRTELEGQVRQVILNPHHPLVLRLRLVGDRILATTLRQLWTDGWDRRTLDDLDGALEEWGLPEPIHSYGFWDGTPLVFDGWLEEGFALFSPLGAGREVDSRCLGVRQVAREIQRYGSLFPAAADRLGLRLYGDALGEWAWGVLSERLDPPNFAADVELVTRLASRQPTAIDQEAQTDELRSRAFEPGVDGALPRIRVRRVDPSGSAMAQVHLSAVVGELVEQFRSTITPRVPEAEPMPYGGLDPRVFFYEPVPDLYDYSFLVGDPPDELSQSVSKAVGYASAHPNQVFRERYAFDPEKCRFPLQQLQSNAHWLVLAAREPLYRAVQQCGTSTLLDFYSATDRGRRVHVCVSLDKSNAKQDVERLRRALGALTGKEISSSETEAILAFARALAPGLAMRCIGSTGGVDLSGLLGLLLSANVTEANDHAGLLLALDQHRDLLAGGGQLGDLLRIRIIDKDVNVDVIEAKFSTGVLHPQSHAVLEAEHQVRSTIQRLEQFSLDHPLILRTRSRLARAIVHRIHLGASTNRATEFRDLVNAVLDPRVKIVIGKRASCSIHAWSVDPTTQELSTTLSEGEHCRSTRATRPFRCYGRWCSKTAPSIR